MSERVRALVQRYGRLDGLTDREVLVTGAALVGAPLIELLDKSDAYVTAWIEARLDEFNPDQPRDELGRFGEGGGSRESTASRESAAAREKEQARVSKKQERRAVNSVARDAILEKDYQRASEVLKSEGINVSAKNLEREQRAVEKLQELHGEDGDINRIAHHAEHLERGLREGRILLEDHEDLTEIIEDTIEALSDDDDYMEIAEDLDDYLPHDDGGRTREQALLHFRSSSGFKGTDQHTEALHKVDGQWTPERAELHRDYLTAAQRDVADGDGVVYMTGGGPAAGKSKGLLQNPKVGIPNARAAVHADPDGAKEWIPEFAEFKHSDDPSVATRVHEESAYMSQEAVKSGLASGKNVVYDSSGDGGIDKLEKKVNAMRANGAKKVVAHYATVDVEEAIKRSDARAKVEGRFVPHAYLRTVHKAVTQTALGAIKRGIYDSLDLWDTTSAGEPRHVATYTKTDGLKVHDESAWQAFKKRGD